MNVDLHHTKRAKTQERVTSRERERL